MALNDLTGQRIKNTYERLVQTDGTQYADGTGSLLDIATTGDIPDTGSLVENITFVNPNLIVTDGDGSTANVNLQGLQTSLGVTNALSIANITGDVNNLETSASNALYTASVSSNTITFEKGDGSTFPLTIDTGSGGVAPGEVVDDVNGLSGSVDLVAGPNITINEVGNTLEISGSIGAGGVSSVNSATGAITISAGPNITVNTIGNDVQITGSAGGSVDTGSFFTSFVTPFSTPNLTVNKGDGSTESVSLLGLNTSLGLANSVTIGVVNGRLITAEGEIDDLQISASDALYTASAAGNTITFEKGDGSTFDVSVSGGGGGTTDTGSLLTTASADYSQITFTKGDGSTFDIDTRPNQLIASVKNISGGTLAKGTPVHVTASASPPAGFLSEVVAADAGDAGLMPAHYILGEDLVDGAEGVGIISGKIQGVDTSAFTEGATIYVAVGGGYTDTKPTGSTNFIQNIGVVTKVDGSNGGGEVFGAGRTNDLPNLTTNYVWVGDSNGVPVASANVPSSTTATEVSIIANGDNTAQPILFGVAGDLPGSSSPRFDNNYNPGDLQFTYNPSTELLSVNEITSSVANITSITGSLLGTASFADDATSASFASTATSASHALKADQADQVYFDTSTDAITYPVPFTTTTSPAYSDLYTDSSGIGIRPSDGRVTIYNNATIGADLDVTGDITGSDVNITGFPSVSASLAEISASAAAPVTVNELDGVYIEYFTRTSAYGNGSYEGKILKFDPGTTSLTTQKFYVYSDGSGTWTQVNNGTESKTRGIFGIALGTDPATDGVLVRGAFAGSAVSGFSAGQILYVGSIDGTITATAPTTAGRFVRAIGVALDSSTIYIDPSMDYYENT